MGAKVSTLAFSTSVTFTSSLLIYRIVLNLNPLNRVGYAVFVSLTPAIIAFVLIRVFKLSVSWKETVGIYAVMLVTIIILQAVIR